MLVVIDVQEKLMPAMAESARITANIVKLLKFARLIDLPIVLTEQRKLGATVAEVQNEIPDVRPIEKMAFDCLACSEFGERLQQCDRDTLIVAGVETHICIAQTVLRALPDHRVHVVSDGTSSRDPHNWSTALERMRWSGATITTTEMAIYELLKTAGTDEFRNALALVKG